MQKNSKSDADLLALRMRAVADITAGVAHEINNPLTVIQARVYQLELMAKNDKLTKEGVVTAARSISETVDRITNLIKALRNLSRKELESTETEIEANHLLDETLSLCRARFSNHGVKMEFTPLEKDILFFGASVALQMKILIGIYQSFDILKERDPKEKVLQLRFVQDTNELMLRISHSAMSSDERPIVVSLAPVGLE